MATSTSAVAVANGTELVLQAPQGSGNYLAKVAVFNVSPFIATVFSGTSQYQLLPYVADIYDVPSTGQGLPVSWSQAPGGPAVAQTGVPSYVITVWYYPQDDITDSYPIALTSQALAAAIAALVTATTYAFEAASLVPILTTATEILNLATVSYPGGTVQGNYRTAYVVLINPTGDEIEFGVWTQDGSATAFNYQNVIVDSNDSYTAAVPISGMDTLWAIASPIDGCFATIVLIQDVSPNPAVLGYDGQNVTPVRTNVAGNILTGGQDAPSYGQTAVDGTATEIVGSNPGRSGCSIHNLSTAPGIVYLGTNSSVTTSTGYALEPGASITAAEPGPIYGITAGATITVSWEDE